MPMGEGWGRSRLSRGNACKTAASRAQGATHITKIGIRGWDTGHQPRPTPSAQVVPDLVYHIGNIGIAICTNRSDVPVPTAVETNIVTRWISTQTGNAGSISSGLSM